MKAVRNWVDPFDEMSDEEFDAQVDQMFTAGPGSVAVSRRVTPDLLGRVKRQAAHAGVPYQTFMKSILEAAVPASCERSQVSVVQRIRSSCGEVRLSL